MRRFGLLILTMLLGAVLPVLAFSEHAPDELDHNRRLLERYRTDPEHYARLLEDLRAFKALPPARQEKMRQFDRALHEEDSETQTRLWEVLERYVAWVDRLPEADRKRLDDATDRTEKLTLVRELRQKEWMDRLPRAEREDLLVMTAPMLTKRVAALQDEEKKNRQEWLDWANAVKMRSNPGSHPKRPVRLADFPESVQTFVSKSLSRMLSDEEKERLKNAEGQKWPRLAKTILELSEKHPVLPPLPSGPIERFNQLPKEAKDYLSNKKKVREELNKNQDKWPQYALAAADLMRQDKHTPPLGASRPAEFDESIQTFIKEKLQPALTADEKTKLQGAEGRWPEYPLRLLELAHKNNQIIPGMSLPGPRELWNNAHVALPAAAQIKLEEFARNELTEEDRAKLAHADNDLEEQLEMLKDLYFNKYHPEELRRLRQIDRRGTKSGKP